MRYLKTWEDINNEIKVEIITPKVAENRQNIFWYYDGSDLASVSDKYHQFTIHIDVMGSGPTAKELNSDMTDDDVKDEDTDDFFRIEFYVPADPNDMNAGSENLIIGECQFYDEAIEAAKKALNDPTILREIAATRSCECERCEKVRREERFDL